MPSSSHAADYGGGWMIDDALVGSLWGPNLTRGGVTETYTDSDWDAIVRHGVRHDGTTAVMPAVDFAHMSDRELADVAASIRELPKVERGDQSRRLGPLLLLGIVPGRAEASADLIDHERPHAVTPPVETLELVEHLAQTCVGCHNPALSGGPGPNPRGLPPSNLTKLGAWTWADFERAMRAGKRPDGTDLSPQMPWRCFKAMTDPELSALWIYLSRLEPRETGER